MAQLRSLWPNLMTNARTTLQNFQTSISTFNGFRAVLLLTTNLSAPGTGTTTSRYLCYTPVTAAGTCRARQLVTSPGWNGFSQTIGVSTWPTPNNYANQISLWDGFISNVKHDMLTTWCGATVTSDSILSQQLNSGEINVAHKTIQVQDGCDYFSCTEDLFISNAALASGSGALGNTVASINPVGALSSSVVDQQLLDILNAIATTNYSYSINRMGAVWSVQGGVVTGP